MTRTLLSLTLAMIPLAAGAQNGPKPGQATQYAYPPLGAFDATSQRVAPQVLPRDDKGPRDERGPRKDKQGDWQKQNALRQADLEKTVRDAMTAHGFSDAPLQNDILAHIQSEAKARSPLRERGRRLFRGLNSPKVGDAEMSLALGSYLTALEADRARRIAAETALDAKIGWSKNPRLHSMLLLFGIIGESPITLPIRAFNQPPRALTRPQDIETVKAAPVTPPSVYPVATPPTVPAAAPVAPVTVPPTTGADAPAPETNPIPEIDAQIAAEQAILDQQEQEQAAADERAAAEDAKAAAK